MKKKFLWLIFLLAFCAGYLAIFPGDFYYDDYHSIRNNTWLISLKNLPRFFTDPTSFSARPRAAMYRPLLLLSYALDYKIYQWRVWGWHLTNLVLHFINSLLVWALVRRIFKDETLAWLSMLIYAFHPIAGELVNYVNCRSSILLSFFLLSALYATSRVISAEGRARVLWIILANLLFLLGILSKESAATFPAIAFLYLWIFYTKDMRKKVKTLTGLIAPMLMILAGYLCLRQIFFGKILSGPFLPRSQLITFFTELKSYFWYLKLFVFPTRLSIEHSFAVESSLFSWRVILSLSGILLLGALVIFSIFQPKSRVAILGFLCGFYVLALAPTSSIVPLNVLVSERAFYPALFAPSVVMALFLRSALLSKKRIASIAIAIIFANFLLMLFYRGRVWQDGYKLWSDAFKKAPDLARVAGELGNEYARRGEAEKAVKFFTLSEQLNSGEPATVYNLGAIYMDLGKLDLAERYLEEAVKLEPDDVLARVNLGVVYQALGKTSLAQYQFETALQLDPNSALAHNNLGDLFFSTGELRKAEAEFQLALKSDPKNELAHFNLGLTYERAGLWQDALEHFQKAYEQNPGAPDYSLWNGIILLKLKKPKEAEEWIKKTLALDDKYAIAWYYLGLAKKEQGDKQSALKALENSLKNLKPFQSDLKSQIEDLISELKTR